MADSTQANVEPEKNPQDAPVDVKKLEGIVTGLSAYVRKLEARLPKPEQETPDHVAREQGLVQRVARLELRNRLVSAGYADVAEDVADLAVLRNANAIKLNGELTMLGDKSVDEIANEWVSTKGKAMRVKAAPKVESGSSEPSGKVTQEQLASGNFRLPERGKR